MFFDYLNLSDKEVASIRDYFAKSRVRVQHGYPGTDINPPLIAILLSNETYAQEFLGTMGQTPLSLGGTIGTGQIWDQSLQLMVYTGSMDTTAYLYELLKAILQCSHKVMAENGIMHPTLAGMDLAPDSRYLPENLFCRAMSFRCQTAYVLPELFEKTNFRTVLEGLFVAPGTARSPQDYLSGIQLFADVRRKD